MARSLVRGTIHRNCYKFYIGGLIFCIFVVFMLTVCNNSMDGSRRDDPNWQRRRGVPDASKGVPQGEVITPKQKRATVTLAVFVMSAPSHFESRNVIRQTWALQGPKNTCVYFVLGTGNLKPLEKKAIITESNKHNDLVILDDFTESYSTLTKKLIETLKWADNNINMDYFMKVDEDTFVRLDQVLHKLTAKPKQFLYWGFFDGRAHVKKTGKWAEKDFVLCDRYLPYALGGGYVLSQDLVHYVATNAENFQIFNNEDVSLGTWLAPLKVKRIHDPNFNTEYKSRGCYNSYLVTHKQSVEDMKELNRSLHVNGRLCEAEYRTRLSYVYNWDDIPTKCCNRVDPSVP